MKAQKHPNAGILEPSRNLGWWDIPSQDIHCHEMPQEEVLKGEELGPGVSMSPSPVPAGVCNSLGRLCAHDGAVGTVHGG